MEGLCEYLDSLSRSLHLEADCNVSEEYCALVVGVGILRDAIKASEKEGETKEAPKKKKADDKGESRAGKQQSAAGKEEKTVEDDIHAIAWSVEYDLARFVG